MSDFLAEMAALSLARSDEAQARTPRHAMQRRAMHTPRPPALGQHPFVLIAEVKRSSPSAGALTADLSEPGDGVQGVVAQAQQYVAGGATIISVLTEPTKFGGSLDHLSAVSAAVSVPVMRKDFLATGYQVYEARAHGASGVLLVVRMVSDDALRGMIDAAGECGLFVLLEAFDRQDFERIRVALDARSRRRSWHATPVLVGLNVRDLRTLEVRPHALRDLGPCFPAGYPMIAESGLETAEDVARAARLGYTGALVGTSLMRADDPAALCREMLEAGRRVHGVGGEA